MSDCKGCKGKDRLFWLVTMNALVEGAPDMKMSELLKSITKGLEANVKYISIINKEGNNRIETAGCTCDSITEDEYIEIFDNDGVLDIELTARKILGEMWDNGAILIMRYKSEMYDVIDKEDKQWIDDILNKKE